MIGKGLKKILVLNASPKCEASATLTVTKAFVEGIKEILECEIEYINISKLNIKPCLGCLSCWGRTAGECVIKDDDALMMKNKIDEADIVIESFPLYFFGMPGVLKLFTDRMMPMMMTYRGHKPPLDGSSFHGVRSPKAGRKFIIISSCAYTQADIVYDSLIQQLNCICGANNYTAIFSPQLKTLLDLNNESKINRYLNKFKEAGKELASNGFLKNETKELLKKPPFSDGAYEIFLDNFWKGQSGE